VTIDKAGKYHDQVLPSVQEAIAKVEDPLGNVDFKNSVSIASKPIPPSQPDAVPKVVNGLAIWDDINPDANHFSIYISGLSNGWSLADVPPDNKQVVRRKTLQLNFKRLGDRYYNVHAGEIRFVPPEQWLYRSTDVVLPPAKAAPAKAAGKAEDK
jgi:hypothetical protein